MTRILLAIHFALLFSSTFSQVAINRDGTPVTDTTAMLEIKKALKSKLKIRSMNFQDTSVLELSNRNSSNLGTDFLITARRELGLYFTTTSDLPGNVNDSLLTLRTNGNIGIGNRNPVNKLDVNGNINLTGTIKTDGVSGQPNQILGTNNSGDLTWINKNEVSAGSSNVGYGSWGDPCSVTNISDYNPVGDSTAQQFDYFGWSVAISGNFAIVGSPADDVGLNQNQGSVSFYQFSGGNWVAMQKISEGTGTALDSFGYSVAISGNFAIVGIKGDDVGVNSNQGSVNIYQFNGTSWVFMNKLTDATGAANDRFGNSVAISGNFALVGAEQDDNGSAIDEGTVSFYQFNGTGWLFLQKVTGPGGTAGDYFGTSVAISNQYAIVGSKYNTVTAIGQGTAITFEYNGTGWALMQTITDGSGEAGDQFGSSVSISGRYAIVGAEADDVASNDNAGSISIYQTNGSVWQLMLKLENTGSSSEHFGKSVSISGNYAMIGGELGFLPIGSVSILVRIGNFWVPLQNFGDPGALPGGGFGYSVSIDGNNRRFLIGVPGEATAMGKAVFGKVN